MINIYQEHNSFLHFLNTRVKAIITLVFILCVSLSPGGAWPAYILFFSMISVGILLSRLNPKLLLLRSLISLPFVLAAFPLMFTGPEPKQLVEITKKVYFLISQPGLIRFVSIAIKSWLSLMAAILLSSTTPFDELLAGFRQLGLPRLLVAILSLMWRYLSIIVDESQSLARARDSRSAGQPQMGTLFRRAGVTGRMVGNLMLRSLERSERVYAAMSARGYSGEPLGHKSSSLSKKDYLILALGVFMCSTILIIALISY